MINIQSVELIQPPDCTHITVKELHLQQLWLQAFTKKI